MKKFKESKFVIGFSAILAIIFAVISLVVFLVLKDFNTTFWLGYIFLALAFVLVECVVIFLFKSKKKDAIFLGIPLATYTLIYLGVAIACSLLFMVLKDFVPWQVSLIVNILPFAIFMVVAIFAILARSVVEEINENVAKKVRNLKSLVVDVDLMVETCQDDELKNKLKKLSETIKYSDPMSNDAVADVEDRIIAKMAELRVYNENGQIEDATKAVTSLEILYVERNRKLAISK